MKAIAIDDYGAQPTLRELPVPEPRPGDVLVKVQAASVNGMDVGIVKGLARGAIEYRFPVVLGRDFAGTIECLGPEADGFAVGDRVFGVVSKPYFGEGTLGEFVAAQASWVAKVPDDVDFEPAAAVAWAGLAAIEVVQALAPAPGETALVAGATGGVGAIVVQMLKTRGLDVIATATSDQERQFVRALGADETVDYRSNLAAEVRVLRPGGVDVVAHLAGSGGLAASTARSGGRLASTIRFTADRAERDDIEVTAVSTMHDPGGFDRREKLERLMRAVSDGSLHVPVWRSYALADAPAAFADFAAGTLGKVAIRVQ